MITEDPVVLLAIALVAMLLAVLVAITVILLRRERIRSREAAANAAHTARLQAQVEELARQLEHGRGRVRPFDEEFVITGMATGRTDGDPPTPEPERHIDGRLFADIVLRETVVKAASLVHGVRLALAPETRNRIRFEMRQSVKQSRRERRVELRDIRRELAARNRAGRRQEGAA